MGPTFTTEIGRMRTQEAIARAEHYRLTQMAKKSSDPDGSVVSQRRRSLFSWRRIVGIATATFVLSVVFAATALAAPTGGGGGGVGHVVPPAPVTPAPSNDPTLFIAIVAAILVAAGAAAWIAWSERRTPKFA